MPHTADQGAPAAARMPAGETNSTGRQAAARKEGVRQAGRQSEQWASRLNGEALTHSLSVCVSVVGA